MNLVVVGASTIAGQYLAGAIRAKGGSDVRRVVSGLSNCATSVAKTHGIAHSGTDLAASAEPAVDAAKSTAAECEKPLATCLADAQDMVLAAERAGLVFAVREAVPPGPRQVASHGEPQ